MDYYVAMNMDAIPILNDGVGGVTVNVTEDFSGVDPSILRGEMKLMGQQSINYVRTRKDVGDQLNLSRIDRQKEYIGNFLEAFVKAYEGNPQFALSTYDTVSPYIVSDCSGTTISALVDRYGNYEIVEVVSPEGENVMGEEYFEFYVDEEKLDALILRLFYTVKK
jgi:anionic cell wall polymer biosynthesis LytR-Cps2A-Psr (LCP) family protein